jgi:curved DNA-binding protein CbpA
LFEPHALAYAAATTQSINVKERNLTFGDVKACSFAAQTHNDIMKFDSPLYDRIRVKPDQDRRLRTGQPACDWPGCGHAASHRAPKGRLRAREYWHFCLDHVREYNHSYNYFAGMSDEAVAQFQKDSITGHRPTWKMGLNGQQSKRRKPELGEFYSDFSGASDPFGMFGEYGERRTRAEDVVGRGESRLVRNAERRALHSLGLENDAQAGDIKARFKALVKRHHPDANGGDRTCEDKLREIIQAYNYLKTAGFV